MPSSLAFMRRDPFTFVLKRFATILYHLDPHSGIMLAKKGLCFGPKTSGFLLEWLCEWYYMASDRAIGVSIRWLMDFMVARFAAVPEHLHVEPVTVCRDVLMGCLEVEADELWSFAQKKTNPHWVWIAMDKHTRQVIAFHVGDRSRDSALELWQNIP